jgi:hypothetical protein
MPVRDYRPAKCHPDKPARNKAGLCDACYRAQLRHGNRTVKRLAEIDRSKQTLEELVAEAERTLQESIPDAARWLRNAAQRASTRGDSRPAETILREVQVPTADGKGKRRLLEPPARQYDHQHGAGSGPQIIVGVSIQNAPPAAVAERAQPLAVPSLSESSAITVEALPALTPNLANRPQAPALPARESAGPAPNSPQP